MVSGTLQFLIIGEGGLNKTGGGGPTDNLNINKRGGIQIKKGGGGSEKLSRSKVAARYS